MEALYKLDWHSMFVPTESVLEVIIRGTLMYVGMYTLLRIFRRQTGSVGIADLLVIVVIADAAQNGMAGDSKSVTEALLLITTIIARDWFFDWLGFRSVIFARIFEPNELLLIKNGRMLRKNMDKEMITEDDLLSQLRLNGVEDISKVKKCFLESNGHFSVLTGAGERAKQKSN